MDSKADCRHHQELLDFVCRVGNSKISFEVKTGVRQGCTMSAILFNMTIDWVMRRTKRRWAARHQMDPPYNTGGHRFRRWSSLGLPYPPTHAGEDDPTRPEEFTYLGSTVLGMMEEQGATPRTISTSPETPLECSQQCMETQYSTITKLRIYQNYVLSILLYGSECWPRTTLPSCQYSTPRTLGEF